MVSMTSTTSEWIGFFKEAGIPAGPAVNYAVAFVDNRIQKNMLLDLNKEIMNELGITAVGDIIAVLKHAKVVHRQEICKALTEPQSQTGMQADLRRNANSPATRMIANSLSRDSPPSTPARRPDTNTSKISVTVSNKGALKTSQAADPPPATDSSEVPAKRRRVTAEMEGVARTSVFDRLGAESKADTTTGNKPTGVFSRLGDACKEQLLAESDDDGSVLQYEGVLKKKPVSTVKERLTPGVTIKAKATSSEPKPLITTIRRLAPQPPASAPAKLSTPKSALAHRLGTVQQLEPEAAKRKPATVTTLAQRLGKKPEAAAQDSKVSSTKPPSGAFKVTFKRTVGKTRVSSTSEGGSAQMDNTGNVSVFQRLGKKSL
uniref:Chromosome 19 open reading frame 47 n=1 Tax=Leptobrachium leishanense TaxID=445787 RepID=A0A8C5Q3I9_9ANUR